MPPYLLPATMLTIGFMVALKCERRGGKALGVGALALILMLPIAIYSFLLSFGPTSSKPSSASARHPGQPAHSAPLPRRSLARHGCGIADCGDGSGYRPGLANAIRSRAGRYRSLLGVVLPPSIQVLTANTSLALLFPWRISARY